MHVYICNIVIYGVMNHYQEDPIRSNNMSPHIFTNTPRPLPRYTVPLLALGFSRSTMARHSPMATESAASSVPSMNLSKFRRGPEHHL